VIQRLYTGSSGSGYGFAQGTDGNYYGFMSVLSPTNYGSVFRLTPVGEFATIFTFNGGSSGAFPKGALVQADDGELYGVTSGGGANGHGTMFRISGSGIETVVSFDGATGGSAAPVGLSRGLDGFLYGAGGDSANQSGSIFRFATNGDVTTIFSFPAAYVQLWGPPKDSPTQMPDGYLYGTTSVFILAGSTNYGSAYEVMPNGGITTLAVFSNLQSYVSAGLAAGLYAHKSISKKPAF
jgi:uncharacterized repeat protein (TIGR03803 family)